jgi:hypothetical protein
MKSIVQVPRAVEKYTDSILEGYRSQTIEHMPGIPLADDTLQHILEFRAKGGYLT